MTDAREADSADLQPLPKLEKKTDEEKLRTDRAEVANIILQALNPDSPGLAYNEKADLSPQYPDKQTGWGLLMKALGTSDARFLEGVLDQVSELCQSVDPRKRMRAINFAWSIVVNLKPQDHAEAMLVLQIAAIHLNTMKSASDLMMTSKSRSHAEVIDRSLNRLARTSIALYEALRRSRGQAEQKFTFQYITVKDGSQAVVGNVTNAATTSDERNKLLQSIAPFRKYPPPPVDATDGSESAA